MDTLTPLVKIIFDPTYQSVEYAGTHLSALLNNLSLKLRITLIDTTVRRALAANNIPISKDSVIFVSMIDMRAHTTLSTVVMNRTGKTSSSTNQLNRDGMVSERCMHEAKKIVVMAALYVLMISLDGLDDELCTHHAG